MKHSLDNLSVLRPVAFALALALSQSAVAETGADDLVVDDGDDGYAVAPVTVTGSRRENTDAAPVKVRVINRKAIERSGAQSAAGVLATRNGLRIVRSHRGSTLQLQGMEGKHVLILIDGERISGRTGEEFDLTRVPAETIERIEVLTGAASSVYGSEAMGGVVNIITRGADKPLQLSAMVSGGSLMRTDLTGSLGTRQGPWRLMLTAGWHHRDAFDLDDDPGTSGGAVDTASAQIRVEWRPEESPWSVLLRANYQYRLVAGVDSKALPPTWQGVERWRLTDRSNTTHTSQVLLRTRYADKEVGRFEVSVAASLFFDALSQQQRGADKAAQVQDSSDHIGTTRFIWSKLVGGSHLLQAGLEGSVECLGSQRVEAGQSERGRLALFVEDEWTAVEEGDLTFVVLAGARLDIDTQFGASVNPRIALRLDPIQELTLRTSFSMGFRAPGFKELYLDFENPSVGYRVIGNPELQPETALSFKADMDARPLPELSLSATFFRHDISDLILSVPLPTVGAAGGDVFSYVNVASTTIQGGEVGLSALPTKGLSVSLSYTFTDPRDNDTGRILSGRSQHSAGLTLAYSHSDSGLGISAQAQLFGPTHFYVEQADEAGDVTVTPYRIETYALVNARASWSVPWTDRAVELFVGVENLLDSADPVFIQLVPRIVYGGLRGRY